MDKFIIDTISEHLNKTQIVSNLSRQKILVMTLCSLIRTRAVKSRGFNLEDTHLNIDERLKKLIGIVSTGYAFCCSFGIFRHENEKPIKKKNHKRKTKNFFRYGLDFLRDGFK